MEALPDDARVWFFGASRPFTPEEERGFLERVDAFLDDWRAHGTPLTVARQWREGHLLLVAVDERSVPPSGCSIDAMVHTLKDEEQRLNVTLVDNGAVFYQSGHNALERTDRAGFGALAQSGDVGPDTIVYDFTVTQLAGVRSGAWKSAARDTWHGRAFGWVGVPG